MNYAHLHETSWNLHESKKNKHQIQWLLRLIRQDAAPGSHQVRPESLVTFQPCYVSSKVKNENGAIQADFRWLWQAVDFSTRNPINKPAMNNRRILMEENNNLSVNNFKEILDLSWSGSKLMTNWLHMRLDFWLCAQKIMCNRTCVP